MNRNHKYTTEHYEYCSSDRQRHFLELVLENKTMDQIGEILGIDPRNAMALGQRIRKTALRHGYNADSENPLAHKKQDLPVKGVSSHYSLDKETGEMKVTSGWVKTDRKTEELIEEAKMIIRGMCEDIPPAPPVDWSEPEAPFVNYAQLLNNHVLTDYHLGMLAWAEECGTDWDTKIAEKFLMDFMGMAIRQAPAARVGLLMQLGDFMHFDGILPVTPTSGHVLDADTRFAKVVRVAIRVLRQIIQMMLKKYPEVRIVMAEGNHDISSSIWMREMLANFYENEPRVTVDINPNPFGAMQHGNTMLAWHHGHKRRIKDLDKVIAGRYPKIFGDTEHRYVHTGHQHHKELMESQLMVAEMHATIAAPDAHAATGGYISQSSADVITYHEKYGEVGRQRFTPALVHGE